jgi:FtsH-binding integral membrane protein
LQYAGLSLYVIAQAVLFMPLLYVASQLEVVNGQPIIATAGIITLILFGGLTAVVWITGANFNWMRNVLFVAGIAAFGAILCSIFMGFSLGIWFSAAMIAFACGWILYDTSAVMHEYRVGQHVAASLALFASVMLLFWYVVRFVMQYTSND